MTRLICFLVCSAVSLSARPLVAERFFHKGYVTAVRSASNFDLDGYLMVFTAKTKLRYEGKAGSSDLAAKLQPYVGQLLEVDYNSDHRAATITAAKITVLDFADHEVSGLGIIDALPQQSATSDLRMVRADGYHLLLPANADVQFLLPLDAKSPLATNLWIRYRGLLREDGTVLVDEADVSANAVDHSEDAMRTKADFDPAVIDEGDKQGSISKAVLGGESKTFSSLEGRGDAGSYRTCRDQLDSGYQTALSANDPTRVVFRFQVVDMPKFKDAFSLGSGIILIPHQVVESLENDSQVAAILADSVAEVLEKQTFRGEPAQGC